MGSEKFAYMWEYAVDDEHKTEFFTAYDSSGTWAKLFLRDRAYLGTDLLIDDSDRNRFVTIDYWTSKIARDAFRDRFRSEFDELDRKCEEFTSSEKFLGDFVVISSPDLTLTSV